jgi:aspartyl-tRNA(Asn)/glutamyl-tRNA(Gln) amidotransferase subunit A
MNDYSPLSAYDLARLIAAKAISPVEVTQAALDQAEETQNTLNAFFHLMPREAIDAAKRAAVSVTGSPGGIKPNGAGGADLPLRDELRANLRAAQGRV